MSGSMSETSEGAGPEVAESLGMGGGSEPGRNGAETDLPFASDTHRENQTEERPARASAPALDAVLGRCFDVLDHGFIRVVDYMGNDSSIVQAARVSYGKGTKRKNQDRGLIRYLMRHRHTTPFEMAEIKLHVKLPIFVARQWIRHRTASVNEYSARYSILDREFYIPEPEQLAAQNGLNGQGRGDSESALISSKRKAQILDMMKRNSAELYASYQEMLDLDENGSSGLARELARINLSLNYYTQWYWKIDAHNLMRFLSLRADSHAQYEIRVYAEVIAGILKRWLPLCFEAFEDYVLEGVFLSKAAREYITALLQQRNDGRVPEPEEYGLSPGEWRELAGQFGLES